MLDWSETTTDPLHAISIMKATQVIGLVIE